MHKKAFVLFALSLLCLSPALSAQGAQMDAKAARLASFASDLDADLHVQNTILNDTAVRFMVSGPIRNGGSTDWQLHLISNKLDGSGWKYERFLGVMQPGTTYNFVQYFEAYYTGTLEARTQYAVVAVGDTVPHGKYFELKEDWAPYVASTRQQLMDMAMVFVPVSGGIIILLIVVLAEWAYASQAPEDGPEKEYTMRSFFLPAWKRAGIGQMLADLTAHPLVWLAELLVLGVMAAAIWSDLGARLTDGSGPTVWALSLAAAALMPAVYFALAWVYNEMVERMPLRFMAGMFMWGITAACLALVFNTIQSQALAAWLGVDSVVLAVGTIAIMAPLIEETLKGIGLLVIRQHHEFSDAMHGLHLGFAVGIGFSFVENWFYLASRTDPMQAGVSAWIAVALYRSFFNALAHGSFSAILGAALGWAKEQKWGRLAILAFLPGLVLAVVLHSLFNLTAISDSFQALSADFPVFGFNPLMTLTLVGMLAILAVAATLDYKKRMRDKLRHSLE
ncbi:Protease prsW family protein [uncultured archaeon]|nr:Protease prsW family protein [uncultured archaeon]